MAFEFKYKGGVAKPSTHMTIKFMMFFIVGGQEVPFYQLRQDGLVLQLSEKDKEKFTSSFDVVKVFVARQGFGIARQFHSFYFRMTAKASPLVAITSFPREAGESESDHIFEARGKFLSKNEVYGILDTEAESRIFLKRQTPLPVDTLRRMITIDRSYMKEGLRNIRIQKQRGVQ